MATTSAPPLLARPPDTVPRRRARADRRGARISALVLLTLLLALVATILAYRGPLMLWWYKTRLAAVDSTEYAPAIRETLIDAMAGSTVECRDYAFVRTMRMLRLRIENDDFSAIEAGRLATRKPALVGQPGTAVLAGLGRPAEASRRQFVYRIRNRVGEEYALTFRLADEHVSDVAVVVTTEATPVPQGASAAPRQGDTDRATTDDGGAPPPRVPGDR